MPYQSARFRASGSIHVNATDRYSVWPCVHCARPPTHLGMWVPGRAGEGGAPFTRLPQDLGFVDFQLLEARLVIFPAPVVVARWEIVTPRACFLQRLHERPRLRGLRHQMSRLGALLIRTAVMTWRRMH